MVTAMRNSLAPGILSTPHTALAAVIVAGAILAPAGRADAFVEDLCYAPGGGPVTNCTPLPEVCRPAGT
jgi:hypothetical protein